MRNLTLICPGGFKDTMKSLQFSLPSILHIVLISLLTLFLNRCDSSNGSKPQLKEMQKITPLILRIIPHDNQAFTQGLLFYNGKIYESTGLQGKSSLRCINAEDGAVQSKIPVTGVFTEGIVIKDNKLIQLTWRSGNAIIYSYPDLKNIGSYRYNGEGWGITTDGKFYIMSNGSDTLYWRDDEFKVRKKTAVTFRGQPLSKINELEYARDRIYANVWFNDFIYEINPESGKVLRIIDCTPLVKQIGTLKEQDVLNGIAYDKEKDSFFITGKYWPLIFEIKISN